MQLKYIGTFLLSFIVGCIFVYVSPVSYKTVIVYPTPSNVKKIQYKDHADNCYRFNAKLVKCTSSARKIPVQ
jgi:hypothetical protein